MGKGPKTLSELSGRAQWFEPLRKNIREPNLSDREYSQAQNRGSSQKTWRTSSGWIFPCMNSYKLPPPKGQRQQIVSSDHCPSRFSRNIRT
jgi:hypothetical protein